MVILSSTMVSTLIVIRRFSIDDAQDFSLTILEETNTKITTFVTEIEYLARSLSEYRMVRELEVEEFRDLFLSQVLPRSRYIRAIYMGTADGRMFEYGQGPGFIDHEPNLPEDYDPRSRPWYRAAIDADRFIVSDPYLYASYPLLGITGAIPVYPETSDPDGETHSIKTIGVVGVDILLGNLRNVLVDLRIPKDGRAVLLDDSGRIIASQFATERVETRPLPGFDPALFDRIVTDRTGSFTTQYRDTWMVMSHTVNPATGWYLVLALPYHAIMQPANSVLRFMAILDLVLIVLLLVTIRVFSGRLVLRPIEEIVQTVNRIHAGDRDARVNITRNDEIGVLAKEFNQLISVVDSHTQNMEAEVQRRTKEVQELEHENSRLRIVEERERIYRDLHDSLGAQLTNISICATVARSRVTDSPAHTVEMIERIDENARHAIEGLRETILGEPDFSSFSEVVDRIEQMAQRRFSVDHTEVAFRHTIRNGESRRYASDSGARRDDSLQDPPPRRDAAETLYRVSQELITNIQKHADATRVELEISERDDVVTLRCADNGVGFDHTADHTGFGLRNMRHRVTTLGGSLSFATNTGGTEVVCTIPMGDAV